MEGPGGEECLTFASPVRFRKLATDKLVVINRFALDPAADLVNRPLNNLTGYPVLLVPTVTIVYGAALAKFGRLELSLSLNGNDPVYSAFDYDVPWQAAPVFSVPFKPIADQLLKRQLN